MKKGKKETIECMCIIIFATFAWWWVSQEWEKPTSKTLSDTVKIYRGTWRQGGYLEVQK